jgi:hypothetical protein
LDLLTDPRGSRSVIADGAEDDDDDDDETEDQRSADALWKIEFRGAKRLRASQFGRAATTPPKALRWKAAALSGE